MGRPGNGLDRVFTGLAFGAHATAEWPLTSSHRALWQRSSAPAGFEISAP